MADHKEVIDARAPFTPAYNFTSHETLSRFTVPYTTYLERNPTVTYESNEYNIAAIASGAVVIRSSAKKSAHPESKSGPNAAVDLKAEPQPPPRVLLLRRAATDSMPNLWEVPGGAVDPEDPSILYGVARELFEEAGLHASAFLAAVGPETGQVFSTRRGLLVCKLHFLVDVDFSGIEDEDGGVNLDENEHGDFCWATEDECLAGKVRRRARDREGEVEEFDLPFTRSKQRAAVLDGFRVWRSMHGIDSVGD